MLLQQINLYKHFAPKRTAGVFYTWRRFCIYNFVVLGLLILIYISSVIEFYYMKSKDNNLKSELTSYEAKFTAIKKTFPELFFNEDINESVKTLKKEVAAQEKIVSILAERTPFSQDLIALSESIVKNVWLTTISIQNNGDEITLIGKSVGKSYLHGFIKNLGVNKTFAKYDIDITNIKNVTKSNFVDNSDDNKDKDGKEDTTAKSKKEASDSIVSNVVFEISMVKVKNG